MKGRTFMELHTIVDQLKKSIQSEHIKINEPLKKYTYTKTGGNADGYIYHADKLYRGSGGIKYS